MATIAERTLASFQPWCKQWEDSSMGEVGRCVQTQMTAALGGANGMAAAAQLLQTAFVSRAQKVGHMYMHKSACAFKHTRTEACLKLDKRFALHAALRSDIPRAHIIG